MNKKLVFLGILLLIGLTLSGCVTVGGYGYGNGNGNGNGNGYDYGYGYYGSPHSYGYYNYGYRYPSGYQQPGRDRDDYRHGSGHDSRHW